MPLIDVNGNAINAVTYHPNTALANAIVKAWGDNDYKERLLTFNAKHITAHGPYTITSRPEAKDYTRTKKALDDVGFDGVNKPVALAFPQYDAVGYQKVVGEVVFVLPDTLVASGFTLPG